MSDIKARLKVMLEKVRKRELGVIALKTKHGHSHINFLDKVIELDDRIIIIRVSQLMHEDIEDVI